MTWINNINYKVSVDGLYCIYGYVALYRLFFLSPSTKHTSSFHKTVCVHVCIYMYNVRIIMYVVARHTQRRYRHKQAPVPCTYIANSTLTWVYYSRTLFHALMYESHWSEVMWAKLKHTTMVSIITLPTYMWGSLFLALNEACIPLYWVKAYTNGKLISTLHRHHKGHTLGLCLCVNLVSSSLK